MKPLMAPRIEGDNTLIQLVVQKNERGIGDFKFTILGSITMKKGEVPPITLALRKKIEDVISLERFKVIALWKGYISDLVIFNGRPSNCDIVWSH